jgi:uncharacterized protein
MGTRTVLLVAVLLVLVLAVVIYVQPRFGPSPAAGRDQPQTSGVPSAAAPASNALRVDAAGADASGSAAGRGIVVVGTGTVQVTPDLAYVTVGTQTRATTAKEAQDQNNATMTAVLASIRRLGIADKDIQTLGLSLSPVYRNDGSAITGYDASNAVTIRFQDINQAGPVLDAAVAAGANTGVSIRFGVKDPDGAYRQALGSAAVDAQAKAAAIAKAMGVQIKAIESAVEESAGMPSPAGLGDLGVRTAAAPAPVQPGEMTITARLRITYSY